MGFFKDSCGILRVSYKETLDNQGFPVKTNISPKYVKYKTLIIKGFFRDSYRYTSGFLKESL
jgi:hypothetical protein